MKWYRRGAECEQPCGSCQLILGILHLHGEAPSEEILAIGIRYDVPTARHYFELAANNNVTAAPTTRSNALKMLQEIQHLPQFHDESPSCFQSGNSPVANSSGQQKLNIALATLRAVGGTEDDD